MWHRKIMRVHHVPIDGLDVRHLRGNRWCENFDHLTVGTRADNMRDAMNHGTTTAGERNYHAKLTKTQVEAIRSDPRLQQEIALQYGISQSAVSRIKSGRTWRAA